MAITYFLLYVILAIVPVLLYLVRRNLNYWKDRGIPHDDPHPLHGNLKGFRKYEILQETFSKVYKKYKGTGPFCGFFFFLKPAAFILDQDLVKNILIKDFSNFADRGVFYNDRDDPLTGHLFALDGAKWKELRQKLSPTFTSGKMKFMFPTVVKVANQFIDVFKEYVNRSDVVEIKELLARYTTDVIGTCAFGIECNSLRDPNAEFRVMGRMAFQKNRHHDLIIGFLQSFPDLARKLRMRQIHEDVHQFFMRIVRETVALREQHKIKRNDFMDLLVELKNTNGLSVEQVAAQAFVFFLAGFETSSTTMSFALYELALNQDVQDKMRQEVNDALAKHNNELTYECMKDMRYTDCVISETLRMYTIVPHLTRQAMNNYEVPGHPKYVIEKGTSVIIPAAAIHRDPEFYPDPDIFNPDRFSPDMVNSRESVNWLPFGDGPRNCIGMRFGQMQSRIGLALLVKNFKFSVCQETTIPMKYDLMSFVLNAEGGIFLRTEKI